MKVEKKQERDLSKEQVEQAERRELEGLTRRIRTNVKAGVVAESAY